MNALILTVGDELLIGQTVDTNSAWMGRELSLAGIRVIRRISVGDTHGDIVGALETAFQAADVVLMTGGLGPTKDDITKKAIADFLGVDLEFHQETYDRILRIFAHLGKPTTEAHRLQALMPQRATLLRNRLGTAPGMWFREKGRILISMPGVPYEMQAIMTDEALPRLRQEPGVVPIFHRTLLTAGLGESDIATRLERFEDSLPDHIGLAYLPAPGQVRLRLSAHGGDAAVREPEISRYAEAARGVLGQHVFGEGEDSLEACLGRMLRDRGLMVATAESCTGGYLAHRLTMVPGSSDYYLGSILAYGNAVKAAQLGVPTGMLEREGAVSEPVVRAMLSGLLERMGADVGMSLSGVAGPGGGTEEKPVGTVWLAVGGRSDIQTFRFQLGKDRMRNIEISAVYAMDRLRLWLLDHPEVRTQS